MKNKLKKSKIIVPALALITATTVASVTGTVAWFTAARTATVNASTFETKALEANLHVYSTGLVGTSSNDSNTSPTGSSTVTVDGSITHGSYNAQAITATTQGKLYVANIDEDKVVSSFSSHGTLADAQKNASSPTVTQHSTWWAGSYTEGTTTKNIWYAVAWKMNFSATHSADDAISLFVDYKSCKFTDATSGGTTMAGLRIALMTDTSVRVIGGENETNHVKGTEKTEVEKYNSGIYHVAGEDGYTKASDKTVFTSNAGLINTMTVDTSKTLSTLEVTAVAWFEGESDKIVTDTDTVMSKVSASLAFYTRINQATA